MYAAGFGFNDAQTFMDTFNTLRTLRRSFDAMWEYRRFGIPLPTGEEWHTAGFSAPRARVYIDAGKSAFEARELHDAILESARDLEPQDTDFYARVLLVVLDHQVDHRRAVKYVRAGIAHAEVANSEARRNAGDDVDGELDLLIALGAKP